jgi:hypothetical protein
MEFDSTNRYVSLETLLNDLYQLFEFESPIYIDELGYRWYRLETVLTVLNIDEDEYINGVYLMIIEDIPFISEEGVNVLILDYDNEYHKDVVRLLSADVMPDIKSDSLYIGNEYVEIYRQHAITYQAINYDDDMEDLGEEFHTMTKMQNYTEKKLNRYNKRDERKNKRKAN